MDTVARLKYSYLIGKRTSTPISHRVGDNDKSDAETRPLRAMRFLSTLKNSKTKYVATPPYLILLSPKTTYEQAKSQYDPFYVPL
jgi:hypothetical protein